MISEEYAERNEPLPADTTEIVHTWLLGLKTAIN
jgi:hypothetical protein